MTKAEKPSVREELRKIKESRKEQEADAPAVGKDKSSEETAFSFDLSQTMRKGHDFKDYICPDSFEFEKDYFKMGNRYGRVIFLREYAAYIKDSMVAELCELNRNMMLSVDVVPVPTDEAVREVENRLLGVETNITNWQRKQNQNNNFSAVIPYDLEQQRKESKEFLDDLTTRDQRMMFAVLTMVHTAESKEQLDNDTEALLTTARKHQDHRQKCGKDREIYGKRHGQGSGKRSKDRTGNL